MVSMKWASFRVHSPLNLLGFMHCILLLYQIFQICNELLEIVNFEFNYPAWQVDLSGFLPELHTSSLYQVHGLTLGNPGSV